VGILLEFLWVDSAKKTDCAQGFYSVSTKMSQSYV